MSHMIEKRLHHDSIKESETPGAFILLLYGEFRIVKIKQVVNGYEMRKYELFSRSHITNPRSGSLG